MRQGTKRDAMRRTVFHLVVWSALAGLVAPAAAASRHHAKPAESAAKADKATGDADDACARLSRSKRTACEAKATKAAEAETVRTTKDGRPVDACVKLSGRKWKACEAREAKADEAEAAAAAKRDASAARKAYSCAKLSGRRRSACEREAAVSAKAEASKTAKAEASRTAKAVASKREVTPADLVGGVEDAPAAAKGSPKLRGALAPDPAVPVAAAPAPRAPSRGARPTRLHEVVLEDGQTLADLAAATGVSVADLAKLNGVASIEDVPTGMRVKVPGAAGKAPTVTASLPPPHAPEPQVAASVSAPPASPRAQAPTAAAPTQTARAERREAAVPPPGSGPRPYASLGPIGASRAPSAPAPGRWGRTQADAMAAYAVASARAPHLADREDARHERFVWPVRAEVVSAFGPHGEGRRNDGLDLAARPGDAVRASAAGEVVYAGKEIAGTGGNLVLLKHADGWVTAYSHLGKVVVAMRQTVDQGQEIAESPDVAGTSVHFEVRQPGAGGAKPVDPASVLPARGGGETGRG